MSEQFGRAATRGYCGRALHVDLSAGTTTVEDFSDEFYQDHLGGLGLGVRVLWDRLRPGADPLGPENIFGIVAGLLVGTKAAFAGRFMVVGKSPVTGGWGEANCGGYFAQALKRCGLDAVFFHGAADRPVYLYLTEKGAEIKDASELWGLDAIETEEKLREIHGRKAQAAVIGPAGERLSLMAGVANDGGRYAARSGLGAVMGSKKIKAVVASGGLKVGAARPDELSRLSRDFRRRLEKGRGLRWIIGDRLLGAVGWITRKGPVYTRQPADLFRQILVKFGTSGLTALSAESGDSPVKNWGGVGYRDFPLKKSQKIGAQALAAYEVKKYGCYSCPIRCGGKVSAPDASGRPTESHRPEYETLCSFGALSLNDDLLSIIRINDLCNRGGLDTISCGAVTAFAVECFENGILTKEDAGGLELRWGNPDSLIRLVEMIIAREGLGDVLADGVRVAARKIGRGSEKFAVHCGGVEPPMHDPKFDPGFAPIYHCDAAPGRHTTASYTYLDLQILEKKFKAAQKIPALVTRGQRHNYDDKGEALAVNVCFKMLIDGLGLCLFGTMVGGDMPLCQWADAAAGWDRDPDDYLLAGRRILNLRQAFNVREGLNPITDFRPHPRVYGDPPFDHGPAKKVTVDLDRMAGDYYRALKWDPETGRADYEHLLELGLGDAAAGLYPEKSS